MLYLPSPPSPVPSLHVIPFALTRACHWQYNSFFQAVYSWINNGLGLEPMTFLGQGFVFVGGHCSDLTNNNLFSIYKICAVNYQQVSCRWGDTLATLVWHLWIQLRLQSLLSHMSQSFISWYYNLIISVHFLELYISCFWKFLTSQRNLNRNVFDLDDLSYLYLTWWGDW